VAGPIRAGNGDHPGRRRPPLLHLGG
jgi:hypothetical protein